jgi:hypothetical protein
MDKRPERDPRAPDRELGGLLIGALAAIIVLGLVYVWSPWGNRTASRTSAGITVGQASTPQEKAQPAPATSAPDRLGP